MNRIKGIIFVIFAGVVFGFIPFFAKTAFENGFNEITFILGECVFATIFLSIYMKVKKLDLTLNKKDILNVFLTSFLGYGVMQYTLVSSYEYMATGMATSIHFIYPLAVMIGGVIFYKEKITFSKIIVLVTAFIGIFFIVAFKNTVNFNIMGFILACGSGILYAYYMLVVGNGPLRKMDSLKLTFYTYLLNLFFFFFASFFTKSFNTNITLKGLSYVMFLSVLSLLGMIALKKGLELINTVTASILSTFEPLTSLLVGVIFLGEVLLFHHIIGTLLILIAVMFAALIEKKEVNAVKSTIKGAAKTKR